MQGLGGHPGAAPPSSIHGLSLGKSRARWLRQHISCWMPLWRGEQEATGGLGGGEGASDTHMHRGPET